MKDRLALAIIDDADKRGALKPGDTVVEATSGNTGIAVAMVCAQRGYNCVITMAEPFSVERRKLMRMLGASSRAERWWYMRPPWSSKVQPHDAACSISALVSVELGHSGRRRDSGQPRLARSSW